MSARRLGEAFAPDRPHRAAPAVGVRGAAAAAHALGLGPEVVALAGEPEGPAWEIAVEADRRDWVRWKGEWERGTPTRAPQTPSERQAWRLAHPDFHRPSVDATATREGIPASLIWAVMQKESAYNPRALSVSDAMGLMQVIPQTAERIAVYLDEGYTDGMLFEPFHAIRYGGWYLGALRRNYRGQAVLATIAYNAGPVALDAWLERNGGRALDVFVEEIPYDQARNYVRRVVAIAVHYAIAHGDAAVLSADALGGLLPERVVEHGTGEIGF